MILEMRNIYTKYWNKVNKANKKRDKIRTCTFEIKEKALY